MNSQERIRDCRNRGHERFEEDIYKKRFGAGGGCLDEASTFDPLNTLEHELQSELNEPRIA
jgi:hypothetical protein